MSSILARVCWPQAFTGISEWVCEAVLPQQQEGLPLVESAELALGELIQGVAGLGPSARLVLLLPAELALFSCVQLPARAQRQALQALPFVVEEQLAEDIEKVHLAVGARQPDGHWPVLAIDLVLMAALVDLATEAGVKLQAVHIDAQLLPMVDNQLSILMAGERVLVSGLNKVAALDIDAAIPMIHLLVGESLIARVQIRHQVGHEQQALLAQQLDTEFAALGDTTVQRETWEGGLAEQLMASRVPAAAINLLQGRFAVRDAAEGMPWWQVAAAVALFAWLGQTMLQVTSGWYFSYGADRFERMAEDQYRALFPDAKQVSMPRKRLESRLAAGDDAGTGVTFSWLFGSAVQALQSLPDREGLTIEQLQFDGKQGELEFELKARTINQLDQYKQELGKLGLAGRISSAAEADGSISGRMQIAKGE